MSDQRKARWLVLGVLGASVLAGCGSTPAPTTTTAPSTTTTTLPKGLAGIAGATEANDACMVFANLFNAVEGGNEPAAKAVPAAQTVLGDATAANRENATAWHKLEVDATNLASFTNSASWDGKADVAFSDQVQAVLNDCNTETSGKTTG